MEVCLNYVCFMGVDEVTFLCFVNCFIGVYYKRIFVYGRIGQYRGYVRYSNLQLILFTSLRR